MVFFHYYFVCVHDFFALLRLTERGKRKVGRTKGRTHSLRASLRFPYV